MQPEKAEHLTRLFLQHRQMLLAYIYTLVLDRHRAEDVLQETAVTLIRRTDDFGDIKNFWALAREIARRHALAMIRKDARFRYCLSDRAIEVIGTGFDRVDRERLWDVGALKSCITKLPDSWQKIIKLRYWMKFPVQQIAEELGRSASVVSVTLNRARFRLADCVMRHSQTGEQA